MAFLTQIGLIQEPIGQDDTEVSAKKKRGVQMDFRYCIVNDCLGLVRQCKMPLKKKMCIEALLYRMKRLLLRDRGPAACGDSGDILSYTELLQLIDAACSQEYRQDALADVTDRIYIILSRLDRDNLSCERSSAP